MACVRQPSFSACSARLIQAAPVSKACRGEGLGCVAPAGIDSVADITAISAEARRAHTWLEAASVANIASKPGLPARPYTKRQGCVLEVDGVQRAASKRLISSAAAIALPVKARGDHRPMNCGSTGYSGERVLMPPMMPVSRRPLGALGCEPIG
jgi:hypothetical protein